MTRGLPPDRGLLTCITLSQLLKESWTKTTQHSTPFQPALSMMQHLRYLANSSSWELPSVAASPTRSKSVMLLAKLAVPFELHNGDRMLAVNARLLHVLQ